MIARMLCVKAELISTRLLSAEDKQDMQQGLISTDSLITAVKVWMNAKMPDYANGHTEAYKAPESKVVRMYTQGHKTPHTRNLSGRI